MSTRILAAPDKFRGTATAREVVQTVQKAADRVGGTVDGQPMSDGGEGALDMFGGVRRKTSVTGPLGESVDAEWILDGHRAVIEMAQASGLSLLGGPDNNDPLEASTKGTGELIAAAMRAGVDEIVVCVGGSATTDGGLGCVKALWPQARLREIDITVVADVSTLFVDAARDFAPQKGATRAQVALLEGRLQRLVLEYERDFGIDISQIPGSGSGGGLAGGLAAVGADIAVGFDFLADLVELDARMENADLVITGEGRIDANSFNGKVVGGVLGMARRLDVPVLTIAGEIETLPDEQSGVTFISLTERFGADRSTRETLACIESVVSEYLDR